MAVMGKYCKAYPISALEAYPEWAPKAIEGPDDGNDGIPAEYVFVQENYTVTRGVFLDEGIVFDMVSPEWKRFCTDVLKFELPDYVFTEEDDTLVVDGEQAVAKADEEVLAQTVGKD